jgi:hypothetical protein
VSQERETSVELRNATAGFGGTPGIPTSVLRKKNNFIIIFKRHKTILEIIKAFSGLTALFQCHFSQWAFETLTYFEPETYIKNIFSGLSIFHKIYFRPS